MGGHNKILRPEMHNAMIRYAILAQEQAFRVKRNPLSQIAIRGASEEIEGADQEMDEVEEGGG